MIGDIVPTKILYDTPKGMSIYEASLNAMHNAKMTQMTIALKFNDVEIEVNQSSHLEEVMNKYFGAIQGLPQHNIISK